MVMYGNREVNFFKCHEEYYENNMIGWAKEKEILEASLGIYEIIQEITPIEVIEEFQEELNITLSELEIEDFKKIIGLLYGATDEEYRNSLNASL
jgi:hypothetical protein